MSSLAIRVAGLGKRYELGADAGMFRYKALRDVLSDGASNLARRLRGSAAAAEPRGTFWALREVSLDVPRGQVLGLVGRNGAGKSTLLKILSRITRPTVGGADIYGRVGSLLEVGTGFHPELTGRDNIFLNGAILGMRRHEVQRNFDAIVDFSGVETFLDTPVKRYSSGMYVRLAFAVAAHLETEILFVDEVLAVGDAEFQRKCLDKMQRVVRDGRTIVFVSHNMAAVKALCERVVLLDRGRVVADDAATRVVDQYLRSAQPATDAGVIPENFPRIGTGAARFTTVTARKADGAPIQTLYLGEAFSVEAAFTVRKPIEDAVFEIGLSTVDGTRVVTVFSTDLGIRPVHVSAGTHRVAVSMAPGLLPRTYAVDVGIHHASHGTTIDMVQQVIDIEVSNVPDDQSAAMFSSEARGFVRPEARWHGIASTPPSEGVE